MCGLWTADSPAPLAGDADTTGGPGGHAHPGAGALAERVDEFPADAA